MRKFSQVTHKEQAPLVAALLEYKKRKDVSFHVPGHKDGQAYTEIDDLSNLLGAMLQIDVTEIEGTDNLHQPEGVILEAQQRAARYFGAEETYFLVGGSTAGNQALILSACTSPDDIILVQRNVHKSVIHGLMLAHTQAVFLTPEIDERSGLATIPSINTIANALERYPKAKGVLLTQPNYYGMVSSSLTEIVNLCHSYDIPVFVDEAHGSHFGLHHDFPDCALRASVDGVVQSTHKMLSAMTMGSMLHVQGNYINRKLLAQRLTMIQSSSPSYPIMASLDLTRFMLEQSGDYIFEEGLLAAQVIADGIKKIKRFGVLSPEIAMEASGAEAAYSAYDKQDPFKVVIFDALGVWNGYELLEKLHGMGCIAEMCNERYVVLALGQGTTREHASRLLSVLEELSTHDIDREPAQFFTWNNWSMDEYISEPIFFGLAPILDEDTEVINVEQSIGRRSAEMITPYPPGIPLLYPQEVITDEVARRIMQLRELNVQSAGANDPTLTTIKICKS